jgi:eukaryotic-like serine/threonine-protein kinase
VAELREQLKSGLADRYRIERELGRGGMATVFLARDLRHDRSVALKVLHPELAATLGPERFQREIKLAARLQHPHILPVHDSGETAGQLWFTMPFVEGESLRTRLVRHGELPIQDAMKILVEVTDALTYAHERGVVHRDIKPDNVLLSGRHALVTDFGVAKAVSEATGRQQLTTAGVALGTPMYMAPEQATADPTVDHRADIYALGVLGYELLAGIPPFTGRSSQEVLAAHMTQRPEPLCARRPACPPGLEAVIMRCLEKRPADRWQTAEELLGQLEPLVALSGGTTPTATRPLEAARRSDRAGRRVPIPAVALGLGFLIGLGVLFGWLRTRPGTEPASKRLAVLPFESTGDTSDRAFATGLSEEIMTRLARVPGLSITARSSALQYPRANQSAPQFGRALGVDYVLDGTVRSARGAGGEKQLRIIPELIKVSDGTHVWGEPYEGRLTDVFRLQADVAERVAEALRGTLGGGDQRAVRAGPTKNLEAFRLYTLGRAEWNQRTPESLERAADYFKQAIAHDSTFARAWAGLADAYALYDFYGVESLVRDTAYARAKAAAQRAGSLDSTLAEPHASLSQILRYGYWDWENSEREIRQAISLDPDYATAHQWLAEHLLAVRHLPEAIIEARTAVQLDPLAMPPQNTLGLALWFTGKVDEAIQVFRTALARDSASANLRGNLFAVYLLSDRNGDALTFARNDTSTFRRALVRARTDQRARSAALRLTRQRPGLIHARLARVYAFLGEREMALAELKRAVAERDPVLEMIKVDPYWTSLRPDPRFSAIVHRVGLPP